MKTKYKFLLGILTVIACILFGCEKRESVSFEELTAVEAEPTSGGSERVKEDVTVEPEPADEEPETLTEENTAQTLKEEILPLNPNCHYFGSFSEIEKFILENCTPGDLLITMGAGDVVNIGEELLSR